MNIVGIVLLSIAGILVLLILIVMIRAILYKPKKKQINKIKEVSVDNKRAAKHLGEILKYKTVSFVDEAKTDFREFDKVIENLKKFYPNIFKNAYFEVAKDHALFFKIDGDSSEKPTVLMAHYDVVPVTDGWDHDPFLGEVVDGYIYGRGAIDTKCTLVAIMESLEDAFKEGYKPKNDLYLCFGANEEVFGESANNRVQYFKKKGIKPYLVLDEGGGIMSNAFPGVKKDAAVLAVAEKPMLDIKLTIDTNGGHSSTPNKNGPIIRMSKALERLDKNQMKPNYSKTVLGLLDSMGRNATLPMRIVLGNMWLFKPLLKKLFQKMGGDVNALVASTFAFTILNGGSATNVIPNHVEANINIRVAPFDNTDKIIKHIRKQIKDDDIKIEVVKETVQYPEQSYTSIPYKIIETTVLENFEDVITSPLLMLGGTDGRHFCQISDSVVRFSPLRLTAEDRKGMHGINERIKVETMGKCVEFYKRLLEKI